MDFFPLFGFFIIYSVQKLKIHEENQREISFKGKGTCNIVDIPGESLDYDLADRAPVTEFSIFFLFCFVFLTDIVFSANTAHI